MRNNFLIIISGPPCTGKTTLGEKIAKEFKLPLISKDEIKESLFDSLGYSDRAWSMKMGLAAYVILYRLIDHLLAARISFIVESNFKPEFQNERFRAWKEKYHFKPLQIQCKTDEDILLPRFKTRAGSSMRHPGHVDRSNFDEFKTSLLEGVYKNLDIGGKVIELDTTDFSTIDYDQLFESIRSAMD